MTSLNELYRNVGILRAQMDAANDERRETKEDIKTILQIVSPLPTTLREFKENHEDFELRLRLLENDREDRRRRIKLAKRLAGWLGGLGSGGLGIALLRKLGIDIPDGN